MKRGHGMKKSLIAIWKLTLAAALPLMAIFDTITVVRYNDFTLSVAGRDNFPRRPATKR